MFFGPVYKFGKNSRLVSPVLLFTSNLGWVPFLPPCPTIPFLQDDSRSRLLSTHSAIQVHLCTLFARPLSHSY